MEALNRDVGSATSAKGQDSFYSVQQGALESTEQQMLTQNQCLAGYTDTQHTGPNIILTGERVLIG